MLNTYFAKVDSHPEITFMVEAANPRDAQVAMEEVLKDGPVLVSKIKPMWLDADKVTKWYFELVSVAPPEVPWKRDTLEMASDVIDKMKIRVLEVACSIRRALEDEGVLKERRDDPQ